MSVWLGIILGIGLSIDKPNYLLNNNSIILGKTNEIVLQCKTNEMAMQQVHQGRLKFYYYYSKKIVCIGLFQ